MQFEKYEDKYKKEITFFKEKWIRYVSCCIHRAYSRKKNFLLYALHKYFWNSITFSGFCMIEIDFVKTTNNFISTSIQFQFLSIHSISISKSGLEKLTLYFSVKAYIAKFSKDNGVTMLTSKEITDVLELQISYHRRLLKLKTTVGIRKSPQKKIVKK